MNMLIGTSWDVKNIISEGILEREEEQIILMETMQSPESLFNHPCFHLILSTS